MLIKGAFCLAASASRQVTTENHRQPHDFAVPYSPIHSKYCIIDDYLVLEGSFNWYNASVFSHDTIIAANKEVAEPYLFEFDQILRRLRIFW